MKKPLVFATANDHKLKELRSILALYEIQGLHDVGIFEEIPEDGETLEENALIKAKYLFNKTGLTALSEDTGLEVTVLAGAPGVHTARYAGDQKSPSDNMEKLLRALQDASDRSAQFRTVICYYDGQHPLYFEGIVRGHIAEQRSGKEGFGYDPVFIPDGYDKTFAALSDTIKNQISHRARAVAELLKYLSK
ncbi:MAG: RdgB/HAM1 family non-canonical purine NTP pyrophosphatase [Chitinophagales bacterium]|nr:RdgB/HAM1 family non-canonical purine NTP pyrophosphatase [Chitinophagales bacterium]